MASEHEEIAALRAEVDRLRRQLASNEERFVAQAEAQRHAAELEALVSSIGDGIAVYGADGSILSVNEAAGRILGHSPETLLLPWDDRLRAADLRLPSGELLSPELAPSRRALKGETTEGLVLKGRRGDGQEIWLALTGAPVRDANGTITSAIVTIRDIRALVMAQQVAERRAGELEAVINSIADAVVIYSRDGSVAQMNPAFAALAHYTEEERGLPLAERLALWNLRDGEDRAVPPGERATERALRGETVVGQTLTLFPDTAREKNVVTSAVPLRDGSGDIIGAVQTTTDITPLVRAQQVALRRAAELDTIIETIADGVAIYDADGRIGLTT
jgi:PAS domain S-box-containing protein